MKKNLLIGSLLLCAGALLGMIAMRSCSTPKEIVKQIKLIDTLTIVVEKIDTVRVVQPVPYEVVVRDTVYTNDTSYVFIHETKLYKDSCLTAQISGINATLDWYEYKQKTETKYVYKTEVVEYKPPKWNIFVNTEYESIIDKNLFKVGGGLEYKDNGNTFSGEGGYDIINKQRYLKVKYKRDIFSW